MPLSNTRGQWRSWNLTPFTAKESGDDAEHQVVENIEREQEEKLNQTREAAHRQAYDEGFKGGHKDGYDAGFKEGLEAGRKQGLMEAKQETQAALAPLAILIREANTAIDGINSHLSESLLQLAVTVGRQLAGEALAANPEQIIALIRSILHEDPIFSEKPTLLLNPSDLALVTECLEQDLASVGWKLRADERLERGGCRIVSADGELDATVETRWHRIIHQLRGRNHG